MPFDATFNPMLGAPQAAAEIQDAIKKHRELQTQGGFNDTIMQHAVSTGKVTPDDYNNYLQSSWTKKQGIANGVAANILQDAQQQQQAVAQQYQRVQMANIMQEMQQRQSAQSFRPNTYQVVGPDGQARTVVQTQQGGAWQPLGKLDDSGGDDGPSQIDPLKDPASGKTVPNKGVVRKTGAVVDTSTDVPQVTTDPSGKYYFDNHARTWKPLNPAFMMTPGNPAPGSTPAPTPAPTPGPSMLNPANWFSGSPTPSPTPAAVPAGPAMANPQQQTGAPAMPTAGNSSDAVLAQARAAIAAGAPKDAVAQRLTALGVDPSSL